MNINIKNTITVHDVDKDGDVEFEILCHGMDIGFYLTQEEVKGLIDFLQKQLKQI